MYLMDGSKIIQEQHAQIKRKGSVPNARIAACEYHRRKVTEKWQLMQVDQIISLGLTSLPVQP